MLSEPEHATLKQFQALAAYDGARLLVSSAAQRAIASEAFQRGMGARGLRSLLEGLLLSAQYDAPEHPGCEIVLDAAGARLPACPLSLYRRSKGPLFTAARTRRANVWRLNAPPGQGALQCFGFTARPPIQCMGFRLGCLGKCTAARMGAQE